MTYQQKMNLRKQIKLTSFLIEILCLGSLQLPKLQLPKNKEISIIKKLLHTIKLYGVELAQPKRIHKSLMVTNIKTIVGSFLS
jgi:hypothetical protein